MDLRMLLIAGVACAAATSALAQNLSRDTNGDGKIDRAEWGAGLKATFEKRDINKDGKMTLGEQAAAGELGGDAGRARMASLGEDHVVMTLERMLAGSDRDFDGYDTNKDGFIDRAELDAYFRPQRDMMADGKVDKAERLAQTKAWFERMDTDKDGKNGRLTLAEALANSAARFDEDDTNKDGFIDRDESRVAALASVARETAQQSQ